MVDAITTPQGGILNQQDLHEQSCQPNRTEDEVGAEASKHVELMVQVAAVDPISQLHEDKHVEDQGIMQTAAVALSC